jgi:putative transcriptional regulator
MNPVNELVPGLLIASPGMRDPRFRGAVILLAEQSEDGALGFVINKTTPFTFSDISKDIGIRVAKTLESAAVHYGGPVSEERGWVLFRESRDLTVDADEDDDDPGIQVGDSMRVSPTIEVLQRFMKNPETGPFRLMLGYTGWGPDQLEDEIAEGSWIPMDLDPELVFETREEDMYSAALGRLGLAPGSFIIGGGGSA